MGSGSFILPLVLMLVMFYFMLIRPENKRKKEAEEMRSALKEGDQITTIGGIVGIVVNIKEDRFVIETSADQVRIEFMKWALSSNDTAVAAAAERKKKIMEERAKAVAAKKAERSKKKDK